MVRALPEHALRALIRRVLRQDRRAIARLISVAENDPYSRLRIISEVYWRTGKAYIIGVTGPPGCGKSTLVSQLAKRYRQADRTVGIVAVDPSSQVTGGAFLGDRIRMGELASDPQIFIRSMATRGYFGGVSRATRDVVRILDASAMDYVIVETAGAGQSDVDVKTFAHTTIVVTAPGLGDEIQALKAGIMEIGDIFVVNKADRESADRTAQEIHAMVMMSESVGGWRPRVMKTTATSGDGVVALVEAISQHRAFARGSGILARRESDLLRRELIDAAKRYFEDITLEKITSGKKFDKLLSQVQAHRTDPYTAARRLVTWAGKEA